ncbi:MAG: YhbY family RNA-binding protein [Clostridia bacterium]|nr:YhbY family RNA-binding protein [Clostridia bacterium]
MLTSKQRSNLIGLSQTISPIGQVGREGVGDNMIKSFSDCLEARELIKVSVLDGCEEAPRAVGEELAEKLRAELVIVIGRKVVLFRRSHKKGIKHIEY